MGWFSKRKKDREAEHQPRYGDEWITVPFRFAEAARVSIHTIGTQEEVPAALRWWIAQWLVTYNSHLVAYMRQNYGPDIFPILDKITESVMPSDDDSGETGQAAPEEESWEQWERQFKEEDSGER